MLITTGEGKFYSNGYDIEWITQLNEEQRKAWVNRDTFALVWRMVTFPMPTIAALNGKLFCIKNKKSEVSPLITILFVPRRS